MFDWNDEEEKVVITLFRMLFNLGTNLELYSENSIRKKLTHKIQILVRQNRMNLLLNLSTEMDSITFPSMMLVNRDQDFVLIHGMFLKTRLRQMLHKQIIVLCVLMHQPTKQKIIPLQDTSKLDKDSEMFEESLENGEHSDFADYGWASIRSFDDLDRIFSNNDPMFGDLGVGNADELWSSSKDITSTPLELTPLSGNSSKFQLGALKTSTNQSETSATGGKIQASRKLLKLGAPATPDKEKRMPAQAKENNQESELDMRTRLCIRDSLYRLTKSATQRQFPNDTSTSSKDEARSSDDIIGDRRFIGMPDVETATNPIDRTVAHLLLHRPPDFSGKPADTSEIDSRLMERNISSRVLILR